MSVDTENIAPKMASDLPEPGSEIEVRPDQATTVQSGVTGVQLSDPISDEEFFDRIEDIKSSDRLIRKMGVEISSADRALLVSSKIYGLNVISRWKTPESAVVTRKATAQEWADTDLWVTILGKYDTLENRKRYFFQEYGKGNLAKLPITALLGAISSLVLGVILINVGILFGITAESGSRYFTVFNVLSMITYCGWSFFLGRAGAAAFIALNLLSITKDASFDISDQTLVETRLTTGSLFAFVISLSIGLPSYREFISQTISAIKTPFETSILLLLPFVLGFSTTLVLALLQQFIGALGAFFNLSQAPNIVSDQRSPQSKEPPVDSKNISIGGTERH